MKFYDWMVSIMKKIPTLFERVFENKRVVGITDKITPGMEWVLDGEGIATIKVDGSCCAIINGTFYKRYDAKKGKNPPNGAIACCDPDPVTGHHPHWVPVDFYNPADKWFIEAYKNSPKKSDGTYEAIGPHFQGNPYKLEKDILEPHGLKKVQLDRSFEGIKRYLENANCEGIVFWLNDQPMCKIKRSDFGFEWPVKN